MFFTLPPKLMCPYPATVLSHLFGYQPTQCAAYNIVLHNSAKQKFYTQQIDRKNNICTKNILEYNYTKDGSLLCVNLGSVIVIISH